MASPALTSKQSQHTSILNQMASLVTSGLNKPEARSTYDRLDAQAKELEVEISLLKKVEGSLGDARQAQLANKVDNIGSDIVSRLQSNPEAEQRAKTHAALRKHFQNRKALTVEERDLIDGQTPGGADVVKQLYAASIRRAAAYVSPVVNLVHTEDASAIFRVNQSDDTSRFHRYTVAGTSSVSANAVDPTVSSTVLDLDSLVSNQIISYQALDDIKDIEGFIQTNFSESIVRSVSLAILKGVDTTGAALPNSTTGGLIASSPLAGTTAVLGKLTYSDIVNGLFANVNLQYFNQGTLLVAPSTYTFLLAQTDTTGRPLYKVHEDGILRIAGRPVFAANELDPVTLAGGTVALFGDFARAYTYGQGPTTTLTRRETFANKLAGSVLSIHRMSGTAGVSAAVKKLTNI